MGSVDKLLDNMVDTLGILRKRVDEYRSALDRSERRNRELEERFKRYRSIESHYKPGDIIIIRRGNSIGTEYGGCMFSKEDYDTCVKDMITERKLMLETDAQISSDFVKNLTIDISKVMGTVVAYNDDCIVVELYSEGRMPEVGKLLLQRLTKEEFDTRIRVMHKCVINNVTRRLVSVVSCYLADIGEN